MRNRPALTAVLAGLSAGGPAAAQPRACGTPACGPSVGAGLVGGLGWAGGPVPTGSSSLFPPPGASGAVVPSREALDRVNLRDEWTAFLPMDGRADGLGPVQVVDGGQVFVQTRAGRLVALDAATGATQWVYRYPKAYANLFPVGLTDRFVFAVNVNTLYCFARYTGLLEFAYDLPGIALTGAGGPAAGPVADARNVYMILGSSRVAAYSYPDALVAPPPGQVAAVGADGRPLAPGQKTPPLADQVAGRYGAAANLRFGSDPDPFRRTTPAPAFEAAGTGLGVAQNTPSVASLARVTPPYTTTRLISTPSIAVLPRVTPPYTTRPPHLQYNQITPSISARPPSVSAVLALSNFRPRPVEPASIWASVGPGRTVFEPIQTPSQLWFTTEGPLAFALAKATGSRQGRLDTSAALSAPPAGPVAVGDEGLLGFFAQEDGTVVAVDLPGGTRAAAKVEWRANVGGYLNHKPVPTAAGIYASGDNAGVARLDLLSGDVVWRTDSTADRLLAVNDEYAYVRDQRGTLLVYPRSLPNNPAAPYARPVARLDLREFNVSVTNAETDRILIGADNGLLLCLRDTAPKYARPVRTAPAPRKPPAPKPADAPPAPPKPDA